MKDDIKQKAIELRKQGSSLRIIAESLDIAKSTASVWLKDVLLDEQAEEKIKGFKSIGLQKAIDKSRQKRQDRLSSIEEGVVKFIDQIPRTKQIDKLACALLYWCEGEKSKSSVSFVNSDPQMIATYLVLFRSAFQIDEKKLRISLHLHEYHQDLQEIEFWSKITAIPDSQFYKIYRKPNTGKNKKENYHGCVAIRYYDVRVIMELQKIWEHYSKKINGRVV
jgi:hypothetical protein